MRPLSARCRPRMVRSSTDLPVPDPPTIPNTSPRRTSRSTPSWMTWAPNRVRSPWTWIAACPAMRITHPDPREQDREQRVEHDHQENADDHRAGGHPTDALGAADDAQALVAAD